MLVDTALEDDAGQLPLGHCQLLAGLDALPVGEPLLDQLLLAGLNGEVRHREGHFLLLRIAVLRDAVTGVPGEGGVLDLALRTRAEPDHLVDVNKMVGNVLPGGGAGHPGLGDHLFEVAPLGVAEELL